MNNKITLQVLPCLMWSTSRRLECCNITPCHQRHGVMLHVFWFYPSVSHNVAGQTMFNRAVPWWLYCRNLFVVFSTKGCQTMPAMTPLERTPICLKENESFGVTSILNWFVRKKLVLKKQGDKIKKYTHTLYRSLQPPINKVLSTTHG